MVTFNEILASIFEAFSSNPDADIDGIILDKGREYGLSESDISDLVKANSLIEDFSKKSSELDKAKTEGTTRKSFMYSEISRLADGRSDSDKKIIISAIQSAAENIDEDDEK